MRNTSQHRSIRSPEQLEEAISINTPKVWLVVVICSACLCAFLIWAAFGLITIKVDTVAWIDNHTGVAYLSEKERSLVSTNNQVQVGEASFPISEISSYPTSAEELGTNLDDEYLNHLKVEPWMYEVRFSADDASVSGLQNASIIVGRVHPLSFLIKS